MVVSQFPAQVDASRRGRVEMAGNSRPRMSLPKSVGLNGRPGRQAGKQRGNTQFKAILEMFKQQHVNKTPQTTLEYNLNSVTAWL